MLDAECGLVLKQLPAYGQDELPPAKTQWVAVHLHYCDACRQAFTQIQTTRQKLALDREPLAPLPSFQQRLLDRLCTAGVFERREVDGSLPSPSQGAADAVPRDLPSPGATDAATKQSPSLSRRATPGKKAAIGPEAEQGSVEGSRNNRSLPSSALVNAARTAAAVAALVFLTSAGAEPGLMERLIAALKLIFQNNTIEATYKVAGPWEHWATVLRNWQP